MIEMNNPPNETDETVRTFIGRMAANGEGVTIWVRADTGATPKEGSSTCARVASLLKKTEMLNSTVIRDPDDPAAVHHEDIAIFTFPPITTEAEWCSMLDSLSGGRTKQPNVIIHAATVPRPLRQLIDICITHTADSGINSIVRYRPDDSDFEKSITKTRMAGLIEADSDPPDLNPLEISP